jgi:hypothetical protein
MSSSEEVAAYKASGQVRIVATRRTISEFYAVIYIYDWVVFILAFWDTRKTSSSIFQLLMILYLSIFLL